MFYHLNRQRLQTILATCVIAITLVRTASAQPSAIEPLPRPLFSIDLGSPSEDPSDPGADDVLVVDNDGVAPPSVNFDSTGLGLGLIGDDLDGLSIADVSQLESSIQPDTFVILFSVGRDAVGAVDPLFNEFPFNVKQQAALGQAAGDEYMALVLFDRTGAVTNSQKNNTLVGNQDDVGGVDGANFELLPLADPLTNVVGMPLDGLDAVLRTERAPMGAGPSPLFFSLTLASPSLPSLPGESSGADIYADPDPTAAGDELIFASASELGLIDADEIDALHVFDQGDLIFDPTVDQLLLSLAPGSPSLPLLGAGPGDILTTVTSLGGPPLIIYAQALDLGLCPEDNVTGIDAFAAEDLVGLICSSAIRNEPTGDANGDCAIDPLDAGFVLARLGCPVEEGDSTCNSADQNGDGVVDPLDVGFVLARLGDPVLGEGACCNVDNGCEVRPAEECIRENQVYRGDGTLCEADTCTIVPECPDELSCCTQHPEPGCDDIQCQVIVCGIDPSCCQETWHFECALLAAQLCPSCAP